MQSKDMAFILLPLVLQMIGLTFAVIIDPYMGKKRRQIMLIIVALNANLVVIDYLSMLLVTRWSMPMVRTLVDIFAYSTRPIILLLFAYIVAPNQTQKKLWFLIALNFLIHLTAVVSPVCFTITGNNFYIRGPLGYTCHIVSGILLIYLVVLTFKAFSSKRGETWIPVLNALLIIAAVIADSIVYFNDVPITFLTIAIVSNNLFYYIWLHQQFVREHEQDLMAEQRIRIMRTQIQPHFLYNTIATFKALAKKDPERAEEVAEKFGTYLRENLDSLGQSGCIPFEKELEHTKTYAQIEMVRFENITVEYDLQDLEFSIPPLSLQPLVENAIRHGVRIRDEGIVRVSTRRKSDCHEITVEDNGVGFDTKEIEQADGKHIGVRNVRERIEKMCGGTLTIESKIGAGTTVTIRIPAKEAAP